MSATVTPIDPRRRTHPAYGPGRVRTTPTGYGVIKVAARKHVTVPEVAPQPRHTLRWYRVRHAARLATAGAILLTSTAIMASVFMLAAWCFNLLFAAFH